MHELFALDNTSDVTSQLALLIIIIATMIFIVYKYWSKDGIRANTRRDVNVATNDIETLLNSKAVITLVDIDETLVEAISNLINAGIEHNKESFNKSDIEKREIFLFLKENISGNLMKIRFNISTSEKYLTALRFQMTMQRLVYTSVMFILVSSLLQLKVFWAIIKLIIVLF